MAIKIHIFEGYIKTIQYYITSQKAYWLFFGAKQMKYKQTNNKQQ